MLPYGNGRSYGDSCHNDAGRLVPMRPGSAIRAFDPDTGLLTADAGVLLSEILTLVMPHGYFLEVTPGTAQVTLGGAIAMTSTARTITAVALLAGLSSRSRCSQVMAAG
jgi:FAD/FMN-containing dehydrogenase